jgi:hypothetical protein
MAACPLLFEFLFIPTIRIPFQSLLTVGAASV